MFLVLYLTRSRVIGLCRTHCPGRSLRPPGHVGSGFAWRVEPRAVKREQLVDQDPPTTSKGLSVTLTCTAAMVTDVTGDEGDKAEMVSH